MGTCSGKKTEPLEPDAGTFTGCCVYRILSDNGFFIVYPGSTKNSEKNLVALNNHLTGLLAEKNEKIFDQESKISLAQNNLKDTVYVVKKEMVYHPVEKIQRITDTVYVQRTVINEKVPAKESLVAEKNDNVSATTIDNAPTNYNTEILIRRNEPKNVKKKWRIRFRFGADRDQVDSKSFALTAEL